MAGELVAVRIKHLSTRRLGTVEHWAAFVSRTGAIAFRHRIRHLKDGEPLTVDALTYGNDGAIIQMHLINHDGLESANVD